MEIPLTPLEFARRSAKLYPSRIAVVDENIRLTYNEFFKRCAAWSSILQLKYNIQQGDRVAYIAPNTHSQLESFYAVPQIGAVLVPINFRLAAEEFEYIINHCGAKVLCVHSDYLHAVDSIRPRLQQVEKFVALEGKKDGWIDYETELTASNGNFTKPEMDERDLLTINYTSGTTGRPKGVMITHRNAHANIMATLAHIHLSVDESYLWTLPMFHANGWTFTWTVTACGGKHVCLRKVDPALVFKLIEQENVSLLCAAPTILIGLAYAPEELRRGVRKGIRLLTAGAPPAATTIERIENEFGWNLTQLYGLTETSPFITICEERPEHTSLALKDHAVIKARQGVELIPTGEVRVVTQDDMEVPWDGHTLGEIVVRGNVVMKGYYNDPEATAQAIRKGWFHSGDLAVVHPDGYIEIRDRIKDVIISGGENISSVEIESVMLRHPSVQEVAVVGMPHEKWGESPHAFVILRTGMNVKEEELKKFVREHLASFKIPHWISFVKELPKTATGKIQKYALRGGRANISKQ